MELEKVSKIHINIKYALILLVTFIILTGMNIYFMYIGQGWYKAAIKPIFAPELSISATMWIVTYITIAFALYCILNSNYGKRREKVLRWFLINISMLIVWSFLFYFKNDPWPAFVDAVLLMVGSFFLIKEVYEINSKAAWGMLIYYAWLGLMCVLNYNIVMLN